MATRSSATALLGRDLHASFLERSQLILQRLSLGHAFGLVPQTVGNRVATVDGGFDGIDQRPAGRMADHEFRFARSLGVAGQSQPNEVQARVAVLALIGQFLDRGHRLRSHVVQCRLRDADFAFDFAAIVGERIGLHLGAIELFAKLVDRAGPLELAGPAAVLPGSSRHRIHAGESHRQVLFVGLNRLDQLLVLIFKRPERRDPVDEIIPWGGIFGGRQSRQFFADLGQLGVHLRAPPCPAGSLRPRGRLSGSRVR